MTNFTPIASLVGGTLIGAAASMLLVLNGRVAGCSGILGGLLKPSGESGDSSWRALFILGLLVGGAIFSMFRPQAIQPTPMSFSLTMAGGFLVGVGTQVGNGCTSGHGVCGLSRFSKRSLVATLTFMGAAFVTVFVVHHVLKVTP